MSKMLNVIDEKPIEEYFVVLAKKDEEISKVLENLTTLTTG